MRQLLQVQSFLGKESDPQPAHSAGPLLLLRDSSPQPVHVHRAKDQNESSDLPALGCPQPRKSQVSTGSSFLLEVEEGQGDWQEPDLSIHGEVLFMMEKGTLRGKKPVPFSDPEATSGLYFSLKAEQSSRLHWDGSSWSIQGVWEEEA